MIDVKALLKDPDAMRHNLSTRHVEGDVDSLLALYDQRKNLDQSLQTLRAEANRVAKSIGSAAGPDREKLLETGTALKQEQSTVEQRFADADAALQTALLTIPNWQAPDTPIGQEDTANVTVREFGTPRPFAPWMRDHVEIANSLGLIDFEAGSKVTGAKFYFVRDEAVLLELALQLLAFRLAAKHGYRLLQTPDLARNEILQGVGFAPRGNESNTYRIEGEELSLIATAEIAVAGMHSQETIPAADLPLRYVASSHCFRTEAGAGGKASKGLYRVHQFGKIELFAFALPEQSEAIHEELVAIEESIYQELGLPYRVVRTCAGDLGAPAYKKYDIEAWMPGKGEQGEYGEVTSASNCTDFQARRLGIRFRDAKTKRGGFVHTLNGTAVALSRTLLAILENYQQPDGSVEVPAALQAIVGVKSITAAADRHAVPPVNPAL